MKSFKRHIVKFIAIVISVMYILMPIHKEVKTALHSVSHYLQMPEVVLSHDLNQNLDYRYKPITSSHQHLIIDLLDCLIDTKTHNSNSKNSNFVDSKIDKHFHSSKYKFIKLVRKKSPSVLDYHQENLKDGFCRKIKVPPQAA